MVHRSDDHRFRVHVPGADFIRSHRYINNPVNAMYVWFIASSTGLRVPVPAACTRQAPGTGVLDLLRRHIDLSL